MSEVTDKLPFWKRKAAGEMNREEWESLCDGCARCCVHKVEDVDTGKVHYTAVACRYLDQDKCRCTEYGRRSELVPNCVRLTADNVDEFEWLPTTCAYRLIAERKDLEWWHPLVSGRAQTVREAGISVRDKVIDERFVHPDDFETQIIRWK